MNEEGQKQVRGQEGDWCLNLLRQTYVCKLVKVYIHSKWNDSFLE